MSKRTVIFLILMFLLIKVLPTHEVEATVTKVNRVYSFQDGLAVISYHGKYGLINGEGKIILPIKYSQIETLPNGFRKVSEGGYDDKYGLLNKDGKVILPVSYEEVSVSENRIRVKKNGKYGFTDLDGKQVIDFLYDEAEDFSEGIARVYGAYPSPDKESEENDDDWYFFIDENGKLAIDRFFGDVSSFKDGVAKFSGDPTVFVDREGKEIFKTENYEVGNFDNGIAIAISKDTSKENRSYLMNKKGKIFSKAYHQIEDFHEDLAIVSVMDEQYRLFYGVIDRSGKEIVEPKYSHIGSFSEGLALVSNNNEKYGYINKKGRVVIPLKYKQGSDFSDGVAVVGNGKKFGVIDTEGNKVVEFLYEEITDFSEGYAFVKSNTNYNNSVSLINKKGRTKHLDAYTYEDFYMPRGRFVGGLSVYTINDKIGVIDTKAREIIPFGMYDGIDDFSEGLTFAWRGDKGFIIDQTGRVITSDLKYESDYYEY